MVRFACFIISILFLNISTLAARSLQDDIYQKNGLVIKGQILEQDQNGTVKFKTVENDLYMIEYHEIESMTQYIHSGLDIIDHIANGRGIVEIFMIDGRVRTGTVIEKLENGNVKLQTEVGKLVILYTDIKKIIQKPIKPKTNEIDDEFYLDPLKDQSLSGPRFGITLLSSGLAEKYEEAFGDRADYVTQFGWQFEKRMGETRKGYNGLYETIFLIAGLERGKVIPSASFLVGIRNLESGEFAFGPNLSLAQDKNKDLQINSGMVIAAGKNHSFGNVMLPVNVAMVVFRYGVRLSIMAGFNSRSK